MDNTELIQKKRGRPKKEKPIVEKRKYIKHTSEDERKKTNQECKNAYNRKLRQEKPEEIKEYMKKYYAENKEKFKRKPKINI